MARPCLIQKTWKRTMNTSYKKRIFKLCAFFGLAVCGLGGFATPVGAQSAVAPPTTQSDSAAPSGMPAADMLTDQELAKRVKAALHAAPYFSDGPVTESVGH